MVNVVTETEGLCSCPGGVRGQELVRGRSASRQAHAHNGNVEAPVAVIGRHTRTAPGSAVRTPSAAARPSVTHMIVPTAGAEGGLLETAVRVRA